MICPLPFSFGGRHVPESLVGNLSPDVLLPFETVYERLGSRGLRTAALADAAIIPLSYADRMLRGVSEVVRISLHASAGVRGDKATGRSGSELRDDLRRLD